jgi:predicted ATPase/signal transduction histidine kinase/GAF domain-containing protein
MTMIDLSDYTFTVLRGDREFVLSRGRRRDDSFTILTLAPTASYGSLANVRRLEHEYALANELDSTWSVRPLFLLRQGGTATLVLEDPGGDVLGATLRRPLELQVFLQLATSLSAALREVHRRGLVHKDIKPQNILMDTEGNVRLTGFGIASRLSRERHGPATFAVEGTPMYMSPEQTGRTNRSIDSRSDLYSLGVTLYELLTGGLPFIASDPMEWIYCHIARKPTRPSERVVGLPAAIEAVILKLLAKSAEDRYQTAGGLETDLRICLAAWQAHQRIDSFPLGRNDVSSRVLVPEKLYGREAQTRALVTSFDRVQAQGGTEIVFVTGQAGTGKSSLVNELHKHLVQPRGFFAAGKFDQYERNLPYATLTQAFQQLVRQILSESDDELAQWRKSLLEAFAGNGRLMVDLIPELAHVVGEQPLLPEVSPHEAQNRFFGVFLRMLHAFARPQHALVLFLDDLQWVDTASLDLLERLIAGSEMSNVLLVCAFRDNEVGPGHPLRKTITQIRNSSLPFQEIALEMLDLEDVVRLLVDALRVAAEDARPLARLVVEKTGGNPFFVVQFITELAEESLLTFDSAIPGWQWDIGETRAKEMTDDVAELMAGKLNRFPRVTLEALKRLACLGGGAKSATMALVLGMTEESVHETFRDVISAGLVLRRNGEYSFLHDRVQEAAYQLIPPAERPAMHLTIGRALASRGGPEEQIFEIVNQLNRGATLIETREEREQVAMLNLLAGKRARSSTAFSAALMYFVNCCELLGPHDWVQHYRLAFDLEMQTAECELLSGKEAGAGERLGELARRAASIVDSAAVARLRMMRFTMLDRSDRAIDAGLEFLREVGIDWSARPTDGEVETELQTMWRLLDGRPIEALIDLPLMEDPEDLSTVDVLAELQVPASFADVNLFHLTLLRMTNLSLERGNCDASACAYSLLNSVLGLARGDYRTALRFGQLGCDLVDKRGLDRFKARVYTFFSTFVLPWTRHLPLVRPIVHSAIEAATQASDQTFGAYSRMSLVSNILASGEPLVHVQRETEQALAFARREKLGFAADSFVTMLWLILELSGRASSAKPFDGSWKDVTAFEKHLSDGGVRLGLASSRHWINKIQVCYFADDLRSAMTAIEKAAGLLSYTASFSELIDFHFFAALTHAAVGEGETGVSRQQHLDAIRVHKAPIAVWAAACPENFAARAALVAAELARLEGHGHELEALHMYDSAVRSANEHGFVQNEAIASELAGRFFASRGLRTVAAAYLASARECYLRWGADCKVRQLEMRYPELRNHLFSAPAGGAHTPTEQIDVGTMLSASQALSSEIVLDDLIDRLMRITIEHAGAERGILVLLRDGVAQVAATAEAIGGELTVAHKARAVSAFDLPEPVLRLVLRSRTRLILDDALASDLLAGDGYTQRRGVRSVLCIPIIKHSQLVGALYLENNLAPRVFTTERITILEFLASQAAISLLNAYLYSDLQRSEAFLAEGQRLSNTGSWSRNLKTGELVWSAQNFLIFGRDPRRDPVPDFDEFAAMIHLEDVPRWRQTVETAIREGTGFAHDFRIVLPTGAVKHLHTVGSPIVNSAGLIENYIGTTIDMTEQIRREDALRLAQLELAHVTRLTTMGELAASIAHEINQPLAAMVTWAEASQHLLAKEPPDLAAARKAAESIVRDGRQAADVLQSIRGMLRKSPSEMVRLNVNDVIREVLELVRGELRREGVILETHLSDDLPPVIGDRVQLQQVVVNLVKNGIEAMSNVTQRPRRIGVTTARDLGGDVMVTVVDSGTGLDNVALKRMFDPFFTTKAHGMGMGLSICRSLVEANGGRLRALPQAPHGAVFQFTLPVPSGSA